MSHAAWMSSGRAVVALLGVFGAVWLALLDATSLAPPVDNIEQLTWVRSLEWGYYKHPPLPTFLLWLPARLFGLSPWTTYVLGALVTLSAMGLLWRFLVAVRGPVHATIALLAMLCITFYNGRLYYFNHNVVLMWFVVVTALLAWKAFEQRSLRWWAGTGLAFGLGALAKYQIGVSVASLLALWVSQAAWRERVHRHGLLLAAVAAGLVFMPHLLWLSRHDFAPVHYALDSSLAAGLGMARRSAVAMHWGADQVLNRALPAIVFLFACAAWTRRAGAAASSRPPIDSTQRLTRSLLLCWGLVPLVFIPMVGVLFGSELQLQWGTAFLLFCVPAVMELVGGCAWSAVPLTAAFKAFAALQALLLVINYATSPIGSKALVDAHWRTFDVPALARELMAPARAELGGPVRVIVGSGAEPGALALLFPEHPVVLIDGRYDRSPWVRQGLVDDCGALQLVRSMVPPAGMTPVGRAFPGLHWRVIAPAHGRAHCR